MSATAMMTSAAITEAILSNGGATWAPGKAEPTTGYMVSRAGCEITIPVEHLTPEHLELYQLAYPLAADEFYGAWVDGRKVYLDVSKNYRDEAEAIAAGIEHQQRAVYDLEAGRDIEIASVSAKPLGASQLRTDLEVLPAE